MLAGEEFHAGGYWDRKEAANKSKARITRRFSKHRDIEVKIKKIKNS
jgi:hypothetical protein